MRNLVFRSDHFILAIDADSLGSLPRANIRKILAIARSDSINNAALRQLREILLDNLRKAEQNCKLAQEDFDRNWKYINKRSRTKAALAVLQENDRLHRAVKRTKAELSTATALWKIFIEKETNENGSSNNQ